MKKQKYTKQEVDELLQKQAQEIEEALPKVIMSTVEPPPNKLSQNQIFAGGQMNMLLRVNEILQAIKKVGENKKIK